MVILRVVILFAILFAAESTTINSFIKPSKSDTVVLTMTDILIEWSGDNDGSSILIKLCHDITMGPDTCSNITPSIRNTGYMYVRVNALTDFYNKYYFELLFNCVGIECDNYIDSSRFYLLEYKPTPTPLSTQPTPTPTPLSTQQMPLLFITPTPMPMSTYQKNNALYVVVFALTGVILVMSGIFITVRLWYRYTNRSKYVRQNDEIKMTNLTVN